MLPHISTHLKEFYHKSHLSSSQVDSTCLSQMQENFPAFPFLFNNKNEWKKKKIAARPRESFYDPLVHWELGLPPLPMNITWTRWVNKQTHIENYIRDFSQRMNPVRVSHKWSIQLTPTLRRGWSSISIILIILNYLVSKDSRIFSIIFVIFWLPN